MSSSKKTDNGENTVKRGRGSPPGPRGPRQVFYTCCGFNEDKLREIGLSDTQIAGVREAAYMDAIPADTAAKAKEQFQEVHSVEPIDQVLGPVYEKKGAANTANKKSLEDDITNLRFKAERKLATAIHNGVEWFVLANMTEDPCVAYCIYTKPVNPDDRKTKKVCPKPRVIPLVDLKNVRDVV